MANLKGIDATGNVVSGPVVLHSVTLTAGSNAATLVVRDGSGTDPKLTLKAATGETVGWVSSKGVLFGSAVHATLTGTNPTGYFEVS
jgi:hypothetical protein